MVLEVFVEKKLRRRRGGTMVVVVVRVVRKVREIRSQRNLSLYSRHGDEELGIRKELNDLKFNKRSVR